MKALRTTVPTDLASAREKLEAALAEQGFGILTEIDVQATFKKKLDVEHEPHRILGVCAPRLGKQALDVDRDVGLLLPCTVTLREVDGATEIAMLDPEHAFSLAGDDVRARLTSVATEARASLAAALEAMR